MRSTPQSLLALAALAALVTSAVPAAAGSRVRTSRVPPIDPDLPLARAAEATRSALSAWRALEGRMAYAVRTDPKLTELTETVASVERIAAQVLPGFLRVPVDLHSLPVLVSRPAKGDLSSPFGVREDPIRKRRRRFHTGIDFHGKRGEPAYAAGPGIVVKARRNGGYGRVVYIDHGLGLQTRYAHLRRIHVKEGDFVPAGALVGEIGSSGRSTGPHLHFEVRMRGAAVDPRAAMDIDLFGDRSIVGTLASLFEPRAAPPRARRIRRTRKPTKRVPRSQRVKDLW